MAFAFNFEDEENNQEQSQGAQKLGPESTVITGEEGKPGGSTEQGSGQYTNLQSYLNQSGNQQFGQEFANKVGEGITQAEQQQGQTSEQFRKAADQSTVTRNDQLINEASSTPESVVGDESKKNQFLQMRDAQYKGPEAFSGSEYYTPAYSATNQAKRRADLGVTESGQKALLGEMYGRPDYTKGQQTLDSMLLGMNPGTRDSLLAQQQRAGKVHEQFGTLTSQLNKYAADAKDTTEATKNAATTALSGSSKQYQEGIQNKANQAISSRDALTQKINQAVRNRDVSSLSDAELASVGIDRTKSMFGYQGDVAQANNALNVNSLTSPEEYARMQAYQDLGGLQNIVTDPTQVGSQIGKPGVARNAATSEWLGNKQAGFQDEVDRLIFSLGAYNNGQNPITYGQKGQQVGDMQGFLFSPQLDALIASSNNPDYRAGIQKLIADKRNEVMGRYGANDYFKGYGPLLNEMGPTIRPKNFRT